MQDFKLDDTSSMPLWAQLKKRLTYLITTGAYAYGEKLPTVRELSSGLGVAYNTVSKVYRDLERDGLIRTKQGSGTFSTYRKDEQAPYPDAAVEALAAGLVEKAREIGMTEDETMRLVRNLWGRGA